MAVKMGRLYGTQLLCVSLLCIVASIISVTEAEILSFSFPPQMGLLNKGDAYFQSNNLIQLTSNQSSTSGLVICNRSIPLWDSSSGALANFSTHFQFIISKQDQINLYGDGMMFFLVPFDLSMEPVGDYFGVFNDEDYGATPFDVVAVEFDTFQDEWDVDDNHVGIDINNVLSTTFQRVSLESLSERPEEENLKNGEKWDAWVDYDGGSKMLNVFLLHNPKGQSDISKPQSSILESLIDLRSFLPMNVKVGLSASASSNAQTHTVFSWNFSSQYSWEISAPNSSPNPNPSPDPNSSPKASEPDRILKSKPKYSAAVIILLCFFASMFVISSSMYVGRRWCFRKGKISDEESDKELDEWFSQGPRRFSYAELAAATKNFRETEKLGEGGFGGVFKGILPGTNEPVAVKRLARGSKQGRNEYVSEVTVISNLRHRNLVQLLGWCHKKEELLLVYELLPNGSLDQYISGEKKMVLGWKQRYGIACDIASALAYLHEDWEQRVVHRDVKSSNVMLDSNFNGKLGDFGLARLIERGGEDSHTTVVAGTMGYLAPECVVTGRANAGADVYSFGALVLEIACGRPPVDRTLTEADSRLVKWVWNFYKKGKILCAADLKLCGNFNAEEMERLMLVGLLCSHPNPDSRPSMREAIKILKLEADLPKVPLNFPVPVYADILTSPSISSNSSCVENTYFPSASISSNSFGNTHFPSPSTASTRPMDPWTIWRQGDLFR
ncbi:L-type lectin-domain containing receptor kinase IX.1 [Cryptomeria japonica]|uniref:L-type lectin-domain containing receptor kinase IX.1 n=1 Tax=Cryptomeria japonica TaxID=3369 RepID=UPI0027DA2108|nr:L-type lectin-domain containing receptor kinase IX.1 [Cryptomeria japonica]